MTTVDHKKIGIMYTALGVFYFLVGGLEALLIRAQLATPNGKVLTPTQYDQVFTMHATTMIFLFIIPVFAGFANYFIPLMIGARDMAFPRLNAFGFWMLLFGGIFLNSSFFLGGAPDSGWFAYAPLTEPPFSPGRSMDFWAVGLTLLGISSIAGSINVIVTTLKMRCPGLRFNTPAALRLDDARSELPAPLRTTEPDDGGDLPPLRPPPRHEFLQGGEWRRPAPLAASLLGFRPPGGLHPHPARLRHHLRSSARLLAQADLRLHLHRLVVGRDRLPLVRRLGPPHVRDGPAGCCSRLLRLLDDADRHPDRREGLQLDGDALGGSIVTKTAAALRGRLPD